MGWSTPVEGVGPAITQDCANWRRPSSQGPSSRQAGGPQGASPVDTLAVGAPKLETERTEAESLQPEASGL